jgi:hypothetical protein
MSRRGIGGFWRSLQRQLGELLGRVGEGEALARPDVEFVGGGVELGSGDGEEVGALGEVLAQQPVGVLVGSALPGSVRIAEEDVDAGVDVDLLPVAHLRALVSTCARHELRMVRGAADSRDVFRAVSENWRRARGRAVASVLASVSDGVGDVATAVCIRQATPPLAKERASVLRCRRARPRRAAGVCKRGDRALASPGVAEPSASSTGAPACRPVRGRLDRHPGARIWAEARARPHDRLLAGSSGCRHGQCPASGEMQGRGRSRCRSRFGRAAGVYIARGTGRRAVPAGVADVQFPPAPRDEHGFDIVRRCRFVRPRRLLGCGSRREAWRGSRRRGWRRCSGSARGLVRSRCCFCRSRVA